MKTSRSCRTSSRWVPARWWLRDLTIGMGHADCLDLEGLTRETLAAARSWVAGDFPTARNFLRAAFELLSQAREKFYPVDAYFVDLVLLDPGTPAGALSEALEARAPFTIIAPAAAIEKLAEVDPDRIAALREAITEGWADVVGGTFSESDEGLLPIGSILFQYRKASETYRAHLDERNVETLASRRFALYPMKPQIARRFGFRFAIHLGLDGGRFPIPIESKRLWESPDASHLESLTRVPVAADRPDEAVRLAWRMARSMRDDQVAIVPMVHWPSPVAGWYRDLRRIEAYAPVMGRWLTSSDFFHRTDRPFEMFGSELDEYKTPYLTQAVESGRSAADLGPGRPFSRAGEFRCDAHARRDSEGLDFSPKVLDEPPSPIPLAEPGLDARAAEEACELAGGVVADEAGILSRLAQAIAGAGGSGPPGYLVFNPTAVARRVPVKLGANDHGARSQRAASGGAIDRRWVRRRGRLAGIRILVDSSRRRAERVRQGRRLGLRRRPDDPE